MNIFPPIRGWKMMACTSIFPVSLVPGDVQAWELIQTFISASFNGAKQHRRRLAKISEPERKVQ
jgi:hypothetical protein